jgi:hypothetical protein
MLFNLSLLENDEGIGKFLKALEGALVVSHIIAGAIVGGFYGGPAGAAQGAADGATIGAAEAAAVYGVFQKYADGDNLGAGAWVGNLWDYFQRIRDTRLPNFLASHVDVSTGPMTTPRGFKGFAKHKDRLTHPMRLAPPATCECGSGCDVEMCGTGQGCYANLCVDNFVSCTASDPFCQTGFREIRQYDTRAKHAEAEYRLEYLNTLTVCNPTPGSANQCPL